MKKTVKKGKFFKKSFSSLKLVVMGSFLVIALALVVNSAQKSQDNRSSAATKTIINDQECKDAGGKCQKTTDSCKSADGKGGYVSGLCPSGDNTIKCCVNSSYSKAVEAEKIAIKQDSECANSGGICQSKKGGCSSSKWVDGKCPSSDSKTIGCCIETKCNSTECECQTVAACRAMKCDFGGGRCHKYVAPTAMPTPKPTGKTNRSACTKNSECISGKCAITDSSKTRVCIPATGTVYVCDYYYKDSYSEKWVDGKQQKENNGVLCKKGCNINTGKCK